jgi:3-dehydroquinate synthase
MSTPRTILQTIDVNWEFPVVFTQDLFAPENPVLRTTLCRKETHRKHRVIVYLDGHVAAALPDLADRVSRFFAAHTSEFELATAPATVPGGEASKNDFRLVEQLLTQLLEHRMDRQSFVIVIGGGAVLDAVGFAAALVHRGLRLIRVPTTVLAQNDAGVGVKNAVNFLGKNAIGTFAPPFAVINDFDLLLPLPDRDWLSGVAEAFKVSIIRDRPFFEELCQTAPRYPERDFAAMQRLVTRCAELHLDHIRTNGDPFEYGTARPLDFGHWSAHKIELLTQFAVSHGEAVAAGVLLDSIYARNQGWLTAEELEAIDTGLRQSGFPLWSDAYDLRDSAGDRRVFEGLREFQEHLGGELCVTFPNHIGARFEVNTIDLRAMDAAVEELRQRANRTAIR